MSDTHDQGAINASSVILNKVRSEDGEFKQIFTNRFHRSGFTVGQKLMQSSKIILEKRKSLLDLNTNLHFKKKENI